MIRTLVLVAALAVGEAQAQEVIILEKIGAVRMSQPEELRRHDMGAETLPTRPEVPPRGFPGQTTTTSPPR